MAKRTTVAQLRSAISDLNGAELALRIHDCDALADKMRDIIVLVDRLLDEAEEQQQPGTLNG